jgi:anti-sigma B factor antagonist
VHSSEQDQPHGHSNGHARRGNLEQPFELAVEQDGTIRVVRISGEFDMTYEQRFEHTVREQPLDGVDKVVMDLSGLTFIDSTGLRSILRYWNDMRGRGFELAVVPGSTQVQRVLATTGLDKVLPTVDGSAGAHARKGQP